MKNLAVLAGFLVLVLACQGAEYIHGQTLQQRWASKVDLNLCPTCIEFSEQAINNLLNIILNVGVVGGCSKICGYLSNQTHSQALGMVCNVLCDVVGVKEFAKLIQQADLDPIYLCELLTVCPVNDAGDATITVLQVTPASGPVGTTFTIDVEYTSKNGTGTGELTIDLRTVDGIPLGSSYLLEAQPAGQYKTSIKVDAQPDPSCDPMQQPCEEWLPGNYTVSVGLCNGECGSKHPHSSIYDQKKTVFVLTGNN